MGNRKFQRNALISSVQYVVYGQDWNKRTESYEMNPYMHFDMELEALELYDRLGVNEDCPRVELWRECADGKELLYFKEM